LHDVAGGDFVRHDRRIQIGNRLRAPDARHHLIPEVGLVDSIAVDRTDCMMFRSSLV
jgi:hypothetical protein